jgi:hypothetical protein
MLRDNLVGLIEPMPISAGVDPLALSIQKQASDDRSSCLENPRPEGAESSLTENVTSPFQAEPAHDHHGRRPVPRSAPAKENNDALEPPAVYIVSGGWDLKTEIPTKKFLGRFLGINY